MCKILSNTVPVSPPQTTSLDEEFHNWYQTLNLESDLYKLPLAVDTFPKTEVGGSSGNNSSFIPFPSEQILNPNNNYESFSTAPYDSSLFAGATLPSNSLFTSVEAQPAIFSDFSFPNISQIPEKSFDSSMDWLGAFANGASAAAATNNSLAATSSCISATEATAAIPSSETEKTSSSSSGDEETLTESKKRKQPSSQTMSAASASATEVIPEALAIKRQKQNEAARKSRQKKQNMIQEAQDRAAKAEREVEELKKRLASLEDEKALYAFREAEMKKKFESLLQRANHFGSNTSRIW